MIYHILLAFVVTFLITLVLGKIGIPMLKSLHAQQSIREEGPESHQAKAGTPTMGGAFMMVALTIGVAIFAPWNVATGMLLFLTLGHCLLGFFVTAVCLGFLVFNIKPAKVFMGDTGSLALGGAFAGMAILTKTELLLVVIGGIFVMEALSVIIQVISFKTRGVRVFKMSPIHHHFELSGWSEQTVVNRFWFGGAVLAILGVILATVTI